ncbi:saccharopine dehydrogenase NADP-binding domain-containing protein [Nocardia yamanashiensis]|uniref:saccharopine dehydrogenase NADP-binding domain-containing protein n=1 Tax=Nocardia yamanashiensis TaxID=209247 RepID=UPI001E367E1C|nr:saccharopine dehydrogenase NADP-binding domain-containing protein [Nocardia yamanashiensis]UGT44637.1 saccharopine dehydrogenase NADP-binding domain-containing protein [Nocardia yamanashiensis]
MTNTAKHSNPQHPTVAVYGATGHTGGYALHELRRRGITPVLVGRNDTRLRAAATAAGMPDAEIRIADLDDPAALTAAFADADVVISTLPAYVTFGEPVLAAAIAAGAHYTDTSGEQLFLKKAFYEYGPRAAAAGVTILAGITNSNLPGDLLAHSAARQVPGPAEIVMSLVTRGTGSGSRGSAETVLAGLDWFRAGGWHYESGELRTGPIDRHTLMTFPGDAEPTAVAKFQQPPVLTIPRHTDVSFVAGVVEAEMLTQLAGFTPELLESLPEPSTDLRYELVLDAIGSDGTAVRGVLTGPDAYRDTAIMAVEAAVRLAGGGTEPGALAPAEAFEPAEFLNSLALLGITWTIERVR